MSEASPHALPARSERAERTRQRILDAAAQSFANGFSKATVEEIAAGAGVSKALVYHHFRGKEAIFEELLERTLSDWARVGRIDEHRSAQGRVVDALAGMVRASLAYARSNPLVRSLYQFDPLVVRFVGSSAAVRRHADEGRGRLVDAIQRGIAAGELRADLDPARVADVARMLVMSLIDHLLNPEWLDASDERFVETCLEVLFHGIAARGSVSALADRPPPAQRGEAERSRARGSLSGQADRPAPAQRGEAERSRARGSLSGQAERPAPARGEAERSRDPRSA